MNIKYRTEPQYLIDLQNKFKEKRIEHHNSIAHRDLDGQLRTSLELLQLDHEIKFGHISIAFIKKMIVENLNILEREVLVESLNSDFKEVKEVNKLKDTVKALIKHNEELEEINKSLLDSLYSQKTLPVGELKEVWSPAEIMKREG